MAEIDTTQILIALTIAVFGIIGTWIADGYLTRNFEKRKKKYEVKLEKYSDIMTDLELMRYFGNIFKLWRSVAKLVDADHESEVVERDYDVRSLIFEYKLNEIALKSMVGLDVSEDYNRFFSEQMILGLPLLELDSIVRLESREKLESVMDALLKDMGEIGQCANILNVRFQKAISDIKLVGDRDLAHAIYVLVTAYYLVLATGMKSFGKKVLDLEPIPPEDWNESIDSAERALAEDLESTL